MGSYEKGSSSDRPKHSHSDMQREGLSDTVQEFGKYQVFSELGRGGMGVVFHAYDKQLRREVALKVVNQIKSEGRQQERFARESQLLARLQHPNVIQIFDASVHNGYQYFTMELIRGKDFTHYLKKNIPLEKILEKFVEVLQGVEYAHRQGVIHRDLKPSNIMISKKQEVKVMDFGLAKDLAGEQLSASLDVVGTPEYMSPEQACGDSQLDYRSDIYSLGIILYQILVGRPPFSGNPINVIYQIVHDDVPFPSQIYAKVPRDLEAVCWKAIQKNPAKRYQDVTAFLEDIQSYLAGEPVSVKPVSFFMNTKRWLARNRVIVAFFILSILPIITFLYLDSKAKVAQLEKQREANQIAEVNSCLNRLESLKMLLLLVKQDIDSLQYNKALQRSDEITTKLESIEESLTEISGFTEQQTKVEHAKQQFHFLQQAYQDLQRYGTQFTPIDHRIRLYTLSEHSDQLVKSFPDKDIITSSHRFANVSQPSFRFYATHHRGSDKRFTIHRLLENEKSFQAEEIREVVLEFTLDDIAFSPNNKYVAFRDKHENVYVETIDGQRIFEQEVNKKRERYPRFFNLQFSPNSRYLLFVSDKKTTIIDVQNKKVAFEEDIHDKGDDTRAHFSSDSNRISIVGDRFVTLFKLIKKKWQRKRITIHADEVMYYDDPRVLVGCLENRIFVYIVDKKMSDLTEQMVYIDTGMDDDIQSLHVRQNYIAISTNSKVQVWNYRTKRKIFEFHIEPSGDNNKIFISKDLSLLGVWTSKCIYQYPLQKKGTLTIDVHSKIKVQPLLRKARSHRMLERKPNSIVALGKDKTFMGQYWPNFFVYNWENHQIKVFKPHNPLLRVREVLHLGNNDFIIDVKKKGGTLYRYGQKKLSFEKPENKPPYAGNLFASDKDHLVNLERDLANKAINITLKTRVKDGWKIFKTWRMNFLSEKLDEETLEARICYIEKEDCLFVSYHSRIFMVPSGKPPELLYSPGEVYHQILKVQSFSEDEVCFCDRQGYFAIYNWKTKKCISRVLLSQPVLRIMYHKEDDIYLLQTRDNIWVYRVGSEENQNNQLYYPFCYTRGLGVNSFDFSQDMKKCVFSSYDGKFIIFPTNLEE